MGRQAIALLGIGHGSRLAQAWHRAGHWADPNPTNQRLSDQAGARTRRARELGRLIQTLYLLRFIDDRAYLRAHSGAAQPRRRLPLARPHRVYGKRGELRQRYRESQETSSAP